jgi:pyridoxal 5'-phosphate synthase pdxT subunit
MTIGVLALQGDVREHALTLSGLGEEVRLVRLPVDLDGLAGLILPGGESTTLSLLLESSGLFDPMDLAFRSGLPVLGTCAGMILLAGDVLDGRPDQRRFGAIDLTVRRNGYGRQVASFESDVSVDGLGPEPLHAVFIRAPRVERVGAGVEVLARLSGDDDRSEPVVCRQDRVLVTSFHPELTGDHRLHQLFVEMTKEDRVEMTNEDQGERR